MLVVNIQEEGRFGGPQKRIAEVAKGCLTYGIKTIPFIADKNSNRFKSLLIESDIEYVAMSLHRLTRDKIHLLRYVLYFPWEVWTIYRNLKRIKPELVHCNGSFQIKGVIASKLAGIPSIWHMNDSQTSIVVYKLFQLVRRFFGSYYIAVSERSASYYFPNFVDSIEIVPSTIDTSIFDPEMVIASDEFDKLEGVKILTVGNVNPVKGYKTLLRAARMVKERSDLEIHFYIAGAILDNHKTLFGELEKYKLRFDLQNVHFLDKRSDIRELLKATDIYVCSSDFEGSPISVWEAMSMGKAVIATDVGDVKNILLERECGLCVPTKDPNTMAVEILKLVNDSELRLTLGQNARKVAIEKFDIGSICQRHVEVYHKVLEAAKDPK